MKALLALFTLINQNCVRNTDVAKSVHCSCIYSILVTKIWKSGILCNQKG